MDLFLTLIVSLLLVQFEKKGERQPLIKLITKLNKLEDTYRKSQAPEAADCIIYLI